MQFSFENSHNEDDESNPSGSGRRDLRTWRQVCLESQLATPKERKNRKLCLRLFSFLGLVLLGFGAFTSLPTTGTALAANAQISGQIATPANEQSVSQATAQRPQIPAKNAKYIPTSPAVLVVLGAAHSWGEIETAGLKKS